MENFVLEKTRSLKGLVSISSTVLPSPLGYLEKKRQFITYKQDIKEAVMQLSRFL